MQMRTGLERKENEGKYKVAFEMLVRKGQEKMGEKMKIMTKYFLFYLLFFRLSV